MLVAMIRRFRIMKDNESEKQTMTKYSQNTPASIEALRRWQELNKDHRMTPEEEDACLKKHGFQKGRVEAIFVRKMPRKS